MSVSILFGLGDDLDLDQRAEVDWGLCLGEGDGDFGLVGCHRFTVPSRESGLDERAVVANC